MNIKHIDPVVDTSDPFANCKLERKQYAEVLTGIIATYPQGFTLAINNEWGSGKTTFVKMWQQQLKNDGFPCIYFNAWENDFQDDPLVAVLSELSVLTDKKNEKIYKTIAAKGAAISKHIVPVLTKAVIKKYIGSDIFADIASESTKGLTELFEDEIKNYATRKKSVADFRVQLAEFVKPINENKSLIFIVDELDRCRPDYAVKLLEHLKHFFSVPGIVFVLSIDKNHLSSSVKGFYGSEHINTEEYLRRFIDLEYSIPRPTNKAFCAYLYNYYSFGDFIHSEQRKQFTEFQYDRDNLLKMAEIIFDVSHATLRQQEKVFALTRLVLSAFQSNQYIFAPVLFILIFIKVMKPDIFIKLNDGNISFQQLSDEFCKLLPENADKNYNFNFLYLLAYLLHFYNNTKELSTKIKLAELDDKGNQRCPIKTILEQEENSPTLAGYILDLEGQHKINDVKIDYLLSKINLTNPINLP